MEKKTKEAVRNILNPFQRFFQIESAGGIILLLFTVIAILWTNSSFSNSYFNLWEQKITISVFSFTLSETLKHWINDGLMAIFFFVAGLEIKRELLIGELSTGRKASLPVFAGLGGMIVPALMYTFLNQDLATLNGWGIPMATDIAFSLGVLSLLGKRVPVSLKVFLVAFAIVDDLGAVSIIAIFYSPGVHLKYLLIGSGLFLYLVLFNLLKLRAIQIYMIFGWIIWYMFLESGIHPTIAGVLIAFTIPLGRKIRVSTFRRKMDNNLLEFCDDGCNDKVTLTDEQLAAIDNMEAETKKVQSPLQSLEHKLHRFVTFVIIPLFAFANASVMIETRDIDSLLHPLTMNIGYSLLIGKAVGIFVFSWIAIKLKLALMPENVKWIHMFGVALLGGMGFTMSIFISNLAFDNIELLNLSKMGIFAGSFFSALLGFLILRISLKKQKGLSIVEKKEV